MVWKMGERGDVSAGKHRKGVCGEGEGRGKVIERCAWCAAETCGAETWRNSNTSGRV